MYKSIEVRMNVYDENGNRLSNEDAQLKLDVLPKQNNLITLIDKAYLVKEISHTPSFKNETVKDWATPNGETAIELYVVKLDDDFLYRSIRNTDLNKN